MTKYLMDFECQTSSSPLISAERCIHIHPFNLQSLPKVFEHQHQFLKANSATPSPPRNNVDLINKIEGGYGVHFFLWPV